MKSLYKNQNIITADEPLIIHGCNAQGVMGAGVALAIKNRFPEAYRSYRNAYLANDGLVLGSVIIVPCEDKLGLKYIGNCITQEFYGKDKKQYCDYDAITDCLISIKNFCEELDLNTFAMPKIGCGLGGGDWRTVSIIINTIFINTNITPVIYDNHSEINPNQ